MAPPVSGVHRVQHTDASGRIIDLYPAGRIVAVLLCVVSVLAGYTMNEDGARDRQEAIQKQKLHN